MGCVPAVASAEAEAVSGAGTASVGAGGASGAVVAGGASCGGVMGSAAGVGASTAKVDDSGIGCEVLSFGGIPRFYRTAELINSMG